MAQVPPSNQPMKFCPTCGTAAAMQAGWCQQCGYAFANPFDPQFQGPQAPPVQQTSATPYVQVVNAYPMPRPSAGLAITAMVLGIVSLVLWCIPILPLVLAVLAVIFGAVGFKQNKGMAITGIVCGGLHFLFWIMLLLIGIMGAGAASVPH